MVRLLEHEATEVASRLFVHGPSSRPPAVNGFPLAIERGSERALVLARARDIVCVSEEVDPAYLAYLAELGLGPAPERVVAVSRFGDHQPHRALWARLAGSTEALRALGTLIRETGPSRLHPIAASRGSFALAAALEVAADTEVQVLGGDPELVDFASRKHHMRAQAAALGIPVAQGEVVELSPGRGRRREDYDGLRRAVRRHLDVSGRVLVRGARGAGGSATYIIGEGRMDVDGLVRALAGRATDGPFLVEVMVTPTTSPAVQLQVPPDGGAITCVGISDQRWERPLVHGGNVYPSVACRTDRMVEWARSMAAWLQAGGFVGPVGVDFVEYLDDATGEPHAFLAEVSPGLTPDAYPRALFDRLNEAQRRAGRPESAAFASCTVETSPRRFADFRRAAEHLLYAPDTGAGVVPYHVGGLTRGRCGVVVLGPSRDAVLRAAGELQSWCRREGR